MEFCNLYEPTIYLGTSGSHEFFLSSSGPDAQQRESVSFGFRRRRINLNVYGFTIFIFVYISEVFLEVSLTFSR